MEITTYRWGVAEQVEVGDDALILFPQGLVGFEQLKRFALLRDDQSAICWFQSLDEPETAFAALDAFIIDSRYDIELSPADAEALQLRSEAEVAVYSLLTVRLDPEEYITANLLAPVVLNTRLRAGRQVILQESGYDLQHRIQPEVLAAVA